MILSCFCKAKFECQEAVKLGGEGNIVIIGKAFSYFFSLGSITKQEDHAVETYFALNVGWKAKTGSVVVTPLIYLTVILKRNEENPCKRSSQFYSLSTPYHQ